MKKFSFILLLILSLFFSSHTFAQAQRSSANPIVWKTNYAKLASSNFYIRIGSTYYYGQEPIRISSDPGTPYSTLEMSWKESNIEMRMNMYFKLGANNQWEMYDLRTYNGKQSGDWIYYGPADSLGNTISSLVGQHNFHGGPVRFLPKDSSIDAEVYCQDCSISAFIPANLDFTESGYALELLNGLSANETITVSTDPMTGYGVNALLRNQNRSIVTDQSGFTYQWTSANPQIATIEAGDIEYAEGGCAYGIQAPCPKMNGQVAGKSPGVTKITVAVLRNGTIIAQNEFDVRVVSHTDRPPQLSPTTVPAVSPVLSVAPNSTPENDDSEQLRKELEVLKGTVGEINNRVEKQQEELNVIQRLLQSISQTLSRLFGN